MPIDSPIIVNRKCFKGDNLEPLSKEQVEECLAFREHNEERWPSVLRLRDSLNVLLPIFAVTLPAGLFYHVFENLRLIDFLSIAMYSLVCRFVLFTIPFGPSAYVISFTIWCVLSHLMWGLISQSNILEFGVVIVSTVALLQFQGDTLYHSIWEYCYKKCGIMSNSAYGLRRSSYMGLDPIVRIDAQGRDKENFYSKKVEEYAEAYEAVREYLDKIRNERHTLIGQDVWDIEHLVRLEEKVAGG